MNKLMAKRVAVKTTSHGSDVSASTGARTSCGLPFDTEPEFLKSSHSRMTTNRTGMPFRLFVGAPAVATDSTFPS